MIIDIKQSWQRDSNIHHGVEDEACINVDKTQPDAALFQILHQERWTHDKQSAYKWFAKLSLNHFIESLHA